MPGGYEWLIIIGVLLLLFGAKKLPDMARSIGQSARVFKGEMKGLKDDETQAKDPTKPAQPLPQAQPAPAAPTAPSTPSVQPQERPAGETAASAQHDRTDVS
jgi:sec-independent protein translocase protein TatA